MDCSLLVDQTFKLYKSNRSIGHLYNEQIDFVSLNLSKFLLQRYDEHNSDIIRRYYSTDDIRRDLNIEHRIYNNGDYQVSQISIEHEDVSILRKHLLIFILDTKSEKEYNTLILNKQSKTSRLDGKLRAGMTTDDFILSLFENIERDEPIVIKQQKMGFHAIKQVINVLTQDKITTYDQWGDIEIIYTNSMTHINENLKHIVINVPTNDIKNLTRELSTPLIETINRHLYGISKIKFQNLSILRFNSTLVKIGRDGSFKLSADALTEISTSISSIKNSSSPTDLWKTLGWTVLRIIYEHSINV